MKRLRENRSVAAGAAIIFAGAVIAAGIFAFSFFSPKEAASVASEPQWTQETGAGISVPACGSSSNTFPTCSGGSPSLTISWTWTVNAAHPRECNLVNVGIYRGSTQVQGYGGRACNDSITWTGGESGTVYSYNVYFLDLDGNPPIETKSGTFTTPFCTPPSASCSASPLTANIGEDVTWRATPSGGLAPTTPKQEWVGNTSNGGWAAPSGGDTAILARRFQAVADYNLKVVSLDIAKESTVTGTLWVTIETDSGGVPSGSVLPNGTSPTITETQVVNTSSYAWTAFYLNSAPLVAGTNYWIVLRGSLSGPAYKIIALDTTAADPNPGSLSLIHSWGAPAWTNTGASYGYRIYAPTYTYSWSGDAPLGGTVNPVTVQYSTASPPPKSGSVTVNDGASSQGPFACSNTVTVYQPTLVITPASPNVQTDSTVQLTALYDPDGPSGSSAEQTVTTSSDWSSSNTAKASVNNTTQRGLVTGNTPGLAAITITATYTDSFGNALTATAAITVTSQPTLTCSPLSQAVLLNQTASLSASGGTGNYQWSAPGGSPDLGNQQAFSTSYSSTGDKTVTVTSGSQDEDCTVSVSAGTLNVSLAANPSSGRAPLNGVDLTATVSGTAPGTINYTFYCNRSDSGTNITSGWAAKFDNTNENPKTAVDACNYGSQGTYTAKVIVERGTATPAESRQTISVDYPLLSASCSVSPALTNIGQPVTWTAYPSGGTGSYTYSWSGTDGLSGTTREVQKSYSTASPPPKTGSVTVTSGSQIETRACSNSVVVSGAIISFIASPATITKGESTTLYWSTSGFSSCAINQGIGSVPTNGNRPVSPTATTAYTLTCNPGNVSSQVTVTVRQLPQFQEIPP